MPAVCEEDTSLDAMLNLSIEELADLPVTSATKTEQKRSHTPATVRVVTAREIQERGYLTLDEALADLPGIQFRNIQGFNSYVFIRGIPNQNNLILLMIDGFQMNELKSGGFYGGGQFNLANVERIEVVYGPASALYGTHAVSGVINIITKKPKDMQGARVSTLVGNFDTQSHDFSYGYYNEKHDLGLSVSGMYKQSDKADLSGSRGDDNWSDALENFEEDYSIDAKFQYKPLTLGLIAEQILTPATKTLGTRMQVMTLTAYPLHEPYAKYDLRSRKLVLHTMLYYAILRCWTIRVRPSAGQSESRATRAVVPAQSPAWTGKQAAVRHHIRLALTVGMVYEHESWRQAFRNTEPFKVFQSPTKSPCLGMTWAPMPRLNGAYRTP